MKNWLNKNRKASCLLGLFVTAGALGYYVFKPADRTYKETASDTLNTATYLEKISGFPKETEFNIQYTAPQITDSIEKTLMIDSVNNYLLPEKISNSIITETQYIVNYTAKFPNDDYVDAILQINKTAGKIKVEVAGLSPRDEVSLSVNGQDYFIATPSDWAGRTQINLVSMQQLPLREICIKTDQNYSICHNVSKRQVPS